MASLLIESVWGWISTRVWKIRTNWGYANFRVQNLFYRDSRFDPHPIIEEMRVKRFIRELGKYLSGFVFGSNCTPLGKFQIWYFRLGNKTLRDAVNKILCKKQVEWLYRNCYNRCVEVIFRSLGTTNSNVIKGWIQ